MLPVQLRADTQVNPLFLTPVEFWGDSDETLLGQFVALLTDVGIDTKYLM
jgi:hypothetical protein